MKRKPLDKAIRGWIIERDGAACYICGLECWPREIHIDHVVPVARGGTDHPGNLRVCCRTCNMRKGKRMPSDPPRIRSKARDSGLHYDARPQTPLQAAIERESQRNRVNRGGLGLVVRKKFRKEDPPRNLLPRFKDRSVR